MQRIIENYKPESAILNLEKKELRLQRKLYTLLLVMMIAFGGLAVVMFKMILAFQVDMDGMRANMDNMTPAIVGGMNRMSPSIVMMADMMSDMKDSVAIMTSAVGKMSNNMESMDNNFGLINQSVGIIGRDMNHMGRDVNQMSGPMRMFFP